MSKINGSKMKASKGLTQQEQNELDSSLGEYDAKIRKKLSSVENKYELNKTDDEFDDEFERAIMYSEKEVDDMLIEQERQYTEIISQLMSQLRELEQTLKEEVKIEEQFQANAIDLIKEAHFCPFNCFKGSVGVRQKHFSMSSSNHASSISSINQDNQVSNTVAKENQSIDSTKIIEIPSTKQVNFKEQIKQDSHKLNNNNNNEASLLSQKIVILKQELDRSKEQENKLYQIIEEKEREITLLKASCSENNILGILQTTVKKSEENIESNLIEQENQVIKNKEINMQSKDIEEQDLDFKQQLNLEVEEDDKSVFILNDVFSLKKAFIKSYIRLRNDKIYAEQTAIETKMKLADMSMEKDYYQHNFIKLLKKVK